MYKVLITLILLFIQLYGDIISDEDIIYFDDTHKTIDSYICDTSDTLDQYLSDKNYSVEPNSLTAGELSYTNILEQGGLNENYLNLKIRLLFPRFRKNYKLTFENYRKSNSIDAQKQENDYLLGLTKGRARVGIKFRRLNPDLFVSYKLWYKKKILYNFDFNIENKISYFIDYKIDNNFQIRFTKKVFDNMIFNFSNNYRYQEIYDHRDEVIHMFSLFEQLNYKSDMTYSCFSYATKSDDKVFKIDYYYSGVSYREFYHKNWAYYQIDTGFIYREIDRFKPKARVMFKVGVLFGNSKKRFIKENEEEKIIK